MSARRWAGTIAAAAAAATGAVVVAGHDSKVEADAGTPPMRTIAARVEQLRDLRFHRLPKVERVSRSQLRRRAEDDVAKMSSRERRALEGGGDVLKLLGFIPNNADVVAGTTDVSDIAGMYDFDTRRLTLVNGAPSNLQAELTYAHELLHALEDDAVGIKPPSAAGADDQTLAYSALAEGSATLLEARYGDKYLGGLPVVRRIANARTRSNRKISFSPEAYYRNSVRFLTRTARASRRRSTATEATPRSRARCATARRRPQSRSCTPRPTSPASAPPRWRCARRPRWAAAGRASRPARSASSTRASCCCSAPRPTTTPAAARPPRPRPAGTAAATSCGARRTRASARRRAPRAARS
jgi:hypothetical protein